jgi:PAS domain S-box-containing protein
MAGAWILSFSRRYRDAQGAFAGSVSASVPVAYLQRHLQGVDVGPEGLVTLLEPSHRLVARNPPLADDEVGLRDRPPLAPALKADLASGQLQGSVQVPAASESPSRAVSWRRLSVVPLVMMVKLSANDYLAAWRREAAAVAAASLTLLALYAAGLALVWRTLTRSRQAHERAALLATVFDRAGESIVVADGDNRILEVNPAFEQLTGYRADEARGRDGAFLRAPRSLNTEHADMRRTLLTRGRWAGEVWNRTKDGLEYPVWLSISVVRDEQGRIVRHVGMATDITERKRISDRLAVSHHALKSISQGVIITGVDGLITEVNQAFCDITGCKARMPTPARWPPSATR